MLSNQDTQIADSRLRFVYHDTVLSYSVTSNTTLGDIAEKLCEMPDRCCRTPIAIDFTLGGPKSSLWQTATAKRSFAALDG